MRLYAFETVSLCAMNFKGLSGKNLLGREKKHVSERDRALPRLFFRNDDYNPNFFFQKKKVQARKVLDISKTPELFFDSEHVRSESVDMS